MSSVTLAGQPDDALRAAADEYRLEIGPVGLQDLVAALGSRPSDTVGGAGPVGAADDALGNAMDGPAIPATTPETSEERS